MISLPVLMVWWGACPPGTGPEFSEGFRAVSMMICVISVTKKDIGKKTAPYVKHALRMVADLLSQLPWLRQFLVL